MQQRFLSLRLLEKNFEPAQKSPSTVKLQDSKAESPTHCWAKFLERRLKYSHKYRDHRNIQTHITQINLIKKLGNLLFGDYWRAKHL
ncbi:hypothetical protein AVEN_265078-1 [Araneus ventricosus]|uniref:Uncharacterized protein n=1 Tax=Araneus ventricosus TaxID=182803 RepID=A0A4Y2PWX8_ARAVE|nr:hypothetical protein AVEN_265078-1 [Araneus ventricosus]